jgi:hypothetical protein
MNKILPKKRELQPSTRRSRVPRAVRPAPSRYRAFLKRLHAGGRSNMYGAIPYLMEAFGVDRESAFRIVCEWLDQQRSEAASPPAAASARG